MLYKTILHLMIDYTSQYQTKITEFCTTSSINLNPNNQWMLLVHILPWDKLVEVYLKKNNTPKGAKPIYYIVIGAFTIKHKLIVSDEETLNAISKN